jgi:glucose/arabinose dehydrogenase
MAPAAWTGSRKLTILSLSTVLAVAVLGAPSAVAGSASAPARPTADVFAQPPSAPTGLAGTASGPNGTRSDCSEVVCAATTVATDTDTPWGLATLEDGAILYTRRDAQDILRLDPATGVKTTVGTVPNVQTTEGEGGLLGLAIAPTFATDHWLYVMHTSPTDNRIVRIQYVDGRLDTSTEQILVSGILRNKYHNGGRLRFGPDGKLYAGTGDAQNGDNAQDTNGLNGKILRINPDGTAPADNPFGNYVWSYGHRNPQGLAFDSQGRLWEQEFGNVVMDETNLIQRGGNYGWPACEGTSGSCATAGFVAPKRTYPTAEGSCSGIAIVRDVLYAACQRGARLYREVISGTELTDVRQFFQGTYGRLRTVEPAPDGGLWLTTTNNDRDSIPNNSNEQILHVELGS